MDKAVSDGLMEKPITYGQFYHDTGQPGQENIHPASQSFPLGVASTHVEPLEISTSVVKPVLNYSIQTGEEFALEFMRDRVNTRKTFAENAVGDSNSTCYLEPKGILGISHTGSESGSDISMTNITAKGPRELERNSYLHEGSSTYPSIRSVPRTSSCASAQRFTLGSTSSGASDSLSMSMKVLCSFGGKILPRPSDGKLRYVGGDTRIVRIGKDILWQELVEKMLTIYGQAHVIKYQLPGEDLDALVSVSSDEDLQNMMEECKELDFRDGSDKLRIFLFSVSDLEDVDLGIGSTNGESEMQYVAAVNGMDIGLRKSSMLHGFASSSTNNLDDLDGQNIEAEVNATGVGVSPLAGIVVSPSQVQSSVVLSESSYAGQNVPQFYDGQILQNGDTKQYYLPYGYDQSTCSLLGETLTTMPFHVLMNQQGGLMEMHQQDSLHKVNSELSLREEKPKNENFDQQEGDPNGISSLKKDQSVVSQSFQIDDTGYSRINKLSAAIGATEKDPEKVSTSVDAVLTSTQVPNISNFDDCSKASTVIAPDEGNSESIPNGLGNVETTVLPQRVYRSERIPREQAELLRRLSKSDDSLGSQFMVSHSRLDLSQPAPSAEVNGNLQRKQMTSHVEIEQPGSGENPPCPEPQTITDGLAQLESYGEFANGISQKTSRATEYGLDGELRLPEASFGDDKGVTKETTPLNINHAKNAHLDHYKKFPVVETVEAGSEVTYTFYKDDGISVLPKHKLKPKEGDILIDIDERFPRDVLSEIFAQAIFSEDSVDYAQLHKDGAGVSLNMENHEPKHWSYFQKLAHVEYRRNDISLIDQDHPVFPYDVGKARHGDDRSHHLTQIRPDEDPMANGNSPIICAQNGPEEPPEVSGTSTSALLMELGHSQLKNREGLQFDSVAEKSKIPESEYQGQIELRSTVLPPLDPSSLGGVDISTLQLIKNEDLEELRELGSGTFGTVYHGKWRGTDVAIKRIKKICFTGRSSEQERLTTEFWREADILSKLHHPNVVAFYGVVQDGPGGTLATVAEFMVDGSLRHVLLRKDKHLDRRKRLIIAMDAAFGMEYLHSKNIVHFDLKCDNLLVNLKDPSRPICKVGDFGLSKIKRNTLVSGGVRGTLPWMAPELLNGSSNKVSEKVDVFSFAIVLWEILTGEEPYANMHYGAIIGGIVSNTLRPPIPSSCDQEWRRLIEQCWAPNPTARPSFTEIAARLRVMSAAA
ncbi:Protein kinase domain-containing protein, partial [Psidium guajava]